MERQSKDFATCGFLALAAIFSWLCTESLLTNAVVLDEYAHLPAGLSHLDLGNYRLYRESPPAVRILLALPVWMSGARRDYANFGVGRRCEFAVGQDFIRANPNAFGLFGRARYVVLLFAVACGALIFWWGREHYGGPAALACAALWFLDPNILAHSSIATTDVGTAALGFAATYVFWRFVTRPGWPLAFVCGVALGVAQSAKFSMLVLYIAWPVGLYTSRLPDRRDRSDAVRRPATTAMMAAILAMSVLTINVIYQFEGTFRPLGHFEFRSRLLSGRTTLATDEPLSGNRFERTPLAALPMPLPSNYVLGFDSQKWEEEVGFYRLSSGALVHRGEWWSTGSTLLSKLPAGTLLFLGISIVYYSIYIKSLKSLEIFITSMTLTMIAAFSSQRGMNWVLRYSIPVLPFLFLLPAPLAEFAWQRRRTVRGAVLLSVCLSCLLWNGLSVLRIRPYYLSFGNELIGGPAGAQRRFLGSNFDWGQDLIRLRQWSIRHPAEQPLVLNYFGVFDPATAGFTGYKLPASLISPDAADDPPTDGLGDRFYWAVSSNVLNGIPNWVRFDNGLMFYCALSSKKLIPAAAIANVGNSIYVFEISRSRDSGPAGKTICLEDLSGCLTQIEESQPQIGCP